MGVLGLLLVLVTLAASPPDKSGVKPSVISLPSGAGSIEGLGESYEPQLNTGSSTYGVSIALPPGRAGLAPKIRLDYNSFGGNGVCGLGWNLEFLSLKRQADKGFPEYSDEDTYIFQGEELVPLSNTAGDWRCENERGFQRLRRRDFDGDGQLEGWEVTEPDGTRHLLGRHHGAAGQWSAVEHPEKPGSAVFDRTYCWMVDATVDLHGNRVDYEYILGTGMLFPTRITYSELGQARHEVLFAYEDRLDAFDDYRPSFSSRLDRRLTGIEVRTLGQLVRRYEFSYRYEEGDLLPDAASVVAGHLDLGVSLLKRVVQYDNSGGRASYLPPLIFTYTGLDLSRAEQRSLLAVPELDLAEPNGRVQLADLNGDGLPDLFATSASGAGTVQRACLNRGEISVPGALARLEFGPAMVVDPSSPLDLALPDTLVHDPKGKGMVDLSSLVSDGPNKRLDTFANRSRLEVVDEGRLGFDAAQVEATVLENPPAFVSYSDTGTRQMDVNFDKKGDFVQLEPGFGAMRVNSFFLGRSGRWTVGDSVLPGTYPIVNTFSGPDGQPNPCVHLADMNGDRMLDLLCLAVESGASSQRISVSYWPLVGPGRYGDEQAIQAMPTDSFDIGTVDLRDVMVEDFTGDGLSDVVVLDGTGLTTRLILRVNIAGRMWSAPYTLDNLPRYEPRAATEPTVVRVADVNGNGSLEIILRNTAPQDGWVYVELMPEGKPSLLSGIDNSLGKRMEIRYGSAAEDEQRARAAGHPWRTHAPMALQVVRQIRTRTGLDLDGDGREDTAVSEFHYRDPYYDGFEREFRGFAFAERVDFGDDFLWDQATAGLKVSGGWDPARTPTGQVPGPSLVTRYRFHTGAPDRRDNDEYPGEPPAFRLIDEITSVAGREEEPLKGLQWVKETVDAAVLHGATDGGFDVAADRAYLATDSEGASRMTPDRYVYTREVTDWGVRRLYRPTEALPYLSDQDADGIFEDYRLAPVAPIPAGRLAVAGIAVPDGSGRSVSFTYPRETRKEVHEANGVLVQDLGYPQQSAGQTRRRTDVDDYGNQILLEELGLEDPQVDDERVTRTAYVLGGQALDRWVIRKVGTVEVTDEAGHFVSRTLHFYDGEPLVGVEGQIGGRALLHRTVQYVTPERSIAASRARFDEYGNAVESADPLGNRRFIEWDETFRSFPIRETVVVGGGQPDLVIEAAYDYRWGTMTESRDFNGNLTQYGYDSFGRLVLIAKPGDSAELPTQTFEYQPADPVRGRLYAYDREGRLSVEVGPLGVSSRVVTRQREKAGEPGEFFTASYSDGTGRTLATVQEGEADGLWYVVKATSHGRRLQPRAEWQPYRVSSLAVPQFPSLWPAGRPPASDGVDPAIVSRDLYQDPTGRVLRTVQPPETWGGTRTEAVVQELPFRRVMLDEEDRRTGGPHEGTPHVWISDGLGRQIATEEVVRLDDQGNDAPLAAWRTEFGYDLNDQVVRIRDSQGNLKMMRYDGLKRMIEMQDPDRGALYFDYDDASNLKETRDARGQRILYGYDGANRILTEDYRDEGGEGVDVRYAYDVPRPGMDLGNGSTGTATNTKGKLAWVQDRAGETHFSYDTRERVAWEIKRVLDSVHGGLVAYRTQFGYDSADRMTQLVYPDGDEVLYDYNARSQLRSIRGAHFGELVSHPAYRPSGKPGEIRYGNGVATRMEYDPRLRLSRLSTQRGESQLLDFNYRYDGVSNIERIEDTRTGPEALARRNTQAYQYDNLYRLRRAEYPGSSGGTAGEVLYRYDPIGNMLRQRSNLDLQENGVPVADVGLMTSGGTLGARGRGSRTAGDPPGPHALSQIAGPAGGIRELEYDDNGNLVRWDGLEAQWDIKDRLARVTSKDLSAHYTYDYSDRRITKRVLPGNGPPVTTHYINQYFEIRDHEELVKYVWDGATRVARVTADLALARRIQHLRLREGWNLIAFRVAGAWPVLDPASNASLGAAAYWTPEGTGNGHVPLTGTTRIPVGGVAWLHAWAAGTVMLEGTAEPALEALSWSAGSQFVGNRLGTPLRLAALPEDLEVSGYDDGWTRRIPGIPEALLEGPMELMKPGQAAWIRSVRSGSVPATVLAGTVQYYHQDHLGSTSVMTDRDGVRRQEIAFLPFGAVRWQHLENQDDGPDPYQFTQKERDEESGLQYFEARYLESSLGRFSGTDPKFTRYITYFGFDLDSIAASPQRNNLYSYAANNPLRYTDPTGLSEEDLVSSTSSPDFDYWDGGGGASAEQSSVGSDQELFSEIFDPVDAAADIAGFATDSAGWLSGAGSATAGTAGRIAGAAGGFMTVASAAKDVFKLGAAIASGDPDTIRDAGFGMAWGAGKAVLTAVALPAGLAVQLYDLVDPGGACGGTAGAILCKHFPEFRDK